MVEEERSPALRRRSPFSGHVLGNRSLADVGAELEEFSMDAGSAPERIGQAHLADQLPYFERHPGPAGASSRFPAPEGAEAGPMPSYNRLRPHDVTASRTSARSDIADEDKTIEVIGAGRRGEVRRSTFNWCRSAITSPSSERLDRKRSRRIHLSRLKSSRTRRSSPDSGPQAKRMEFAVATGTRWLIRVNQIARGHPMRSFIERWKMSQVACNVVCRYGCKNLRKVRR